MVESCNTLAKTKGLMMIDLLGIESSLVTLGMLFLSPYLGPRPGCPMQSEVIVFGFMFFLGLAKTHAH